VEPFLPTLREVMGNPNYLAHLEKTVKELPNCEARLAAVRERMQKIIEAYLQRAAAQAAAAGN
jgi:exonuclease VII small subunit